MNNKIMFMGLIGPVQVSSFYNSLYMITAGLAGLFIAIFSLYVILSFINRISSISINFKNKPDDSMNGENDLHVD